MKILKRLRFVEVLIALLLLCPLGYAATRALQIELLRDPVIDYRDGSVAASYVAYFYSAGTQDAKNVWTEKEKTNAYTYRTLETDGTTAVYGDGIYKIIVKDTGGTTVYTWDNVKVQANTYIVSTKSGDSDISKDYDAILVDTTSGDVRLNLDAVSGFEHPLKVKNIGANNVIIDPDSTETVDGSSTYTIYSTNQVIELIPDTNAGTWRIGQLTENQLVDSDEDTKIQVEESADDDIIRFDNAGTEQLTIQDGKIEPTTDNDIDLGASGKEFKNAYVDGVGYIDTVQTDVIQEDTGANGVTIDGLKIKDGDIEPPGNMLDVDGLIRLNYTGGQIRITETDGSDSNDYFLIERQSENFNIKNYDASGPTTTNILTATPAGIVSIHNSVAVDTVSERTAANGVTIDSLSIKDGKLNTNDSVVEANITNGAATEDKIGTGAVTSSKIPADTINPNHFEDYVVNIGVHGDEYSENGTSYVQKIVYCFYNSANASDAVYVRSRMKQTDTSYTARVRTTFGGSVSVVQSVTGAGSDSYTWQSDSVDISSLGNGWINVVVEMEVNNALTTCYLWGHVVVYQ